MPVPVTTFYAGLNAAIGLTLAMLVVRQRLATQTLFGDGGRRPVEQAMRAHANFVEYVPLILLLLLVLELDGLPRAWLHLMGATLTVGRVLHGWGLSREAGRSLGRSAGAGLTWTVMLGALLTAIVRGVSGL
jgi:uncharacterized membrane protein YecN with MAPEG domain